MRVGIALIPDAAFLEVPIGLRARMSDSDVFGPALGRESNLPHVSLLQADFRPGYDPTVILGEVDRFMAHDASVDELQFEEVVHHSPDWLFWLCRRDSWLVDLQGSVISACEAEIDTTLIDRSRARPELSDDERRAFMRYGFRFVGDAFLPHVTLGRVATGAAEHVVREANALRRSVVSHSRVDYVTTYEVGEDGAHARTIASVSL